MKGIASKIILLLVISSLGCSGQQKLKNQRVESDFLSIDSALNSYRLLAGIYPTTEQGLEALFEKPQKPPVPKRWAQLVKEVPKDPWGRHYQYTYKDGKINLWSKGPAEDDPSDDIVFELPEKKE